jgi:hypothetical protein
MKISSVRWALYDNSIMFMIDLRNKALTITVVAETALGLRDFV